jgi:hypothetical protein
LYVAPRTFTRKYCKVPYLYSVRPDPWRYSSGNWNYLFEHRRLHHTLDWDGGGLLAEIFWYFPFFSMTRTTVYKQNLIGTQGLMVDKKQIKSNESIWKEKGFRLPCGLDLRFPSLFPSLCTTVPRRHLSSRKKSIYLKNLLVRWLFLLLFFQTNMKILHTNSSKILLLTISLDCIEYWLGVENLNSLLVTWVKLTCTLNWLCI